MKVLLRVYVAAVLALGVTCVANGHQGADAHHVVRADGSWCC